MTIYTKVSLPTSTSWFSGGGGRKLESLAACENVTEIGRERERDAPFSRRLHQSGGKIGNRKSRKRRWATLSRKQRRRLIIYRRREKKRERDASSFPAYSQCRLDDFIRSSKTISPLFRLPPSYTTLSLLLADGAVEIQWGMP